MSYTGTVHTGKLRVRQGGPSRKYKAYSKLGKGAKVIVDYAIRGQEVRDFDIWYKLAASDLYVWGGWIALDNGVSYMEILQSKKVVFTADDYGVVPSINAGVKRAVLEGKLRSVACFTNYVDIQGNNKSLEYIRELEDIGPPVELGVHLTITSGDPLLPPDKTFMICQKDNPPGEKFFDFTEILQHYKSHNKSDREIFLQQLKAELAAQIDVFSNPPDGKAPIPVHHITCHHNSLLFHKDLFTAMIEVIQNYQFKTLFKPAIRSLENKPSWKDYGYMLLKGKISLPYALIFKSKLDKIAEDVKQMELLHSNHFGPLPKKNIGRDDLEGHVRIKIRRASKMLEDLNTSGEFQSMEFLLHLREGVIRDSGEYGDEITNYAGVNPQSFDSRKAELESFLNIFSRNSTIPHRVEQSSWEELHWST